MTAGDPSSRANAVGGDHGGEGIHMDKVIVLPTVAAVGAEVEAGPAPHGQNRRLPDQARRLGRLCEHAELVGQGAAHDIDRLVPAALREVRATRADDLYVSAKIGTVEVVVQVLDAYE